jgi:hypothetical protein
LDFLSTHATPTLQPIPLSEIEAYISNLSRAIFSF